MEKLRLRKDTTILGQSTASKGEFKDKQAHLRLILTFIQSHMCPLKCRVHEFITLLQAKAKQTHALHTHDSSISLGGYSVNWGPNWVIQEP